MVLRKLAVALAVLVVLAGGCGRSPSLEKELVGLCEEYTGLFAARKYDECARYLTGQALMEFEASRPLLEAMGQIETKVSDFRGKVDFLNRPRDRASVRCTWVQETSVPGSGTWTLKADVVYELVKLKDRWLISSIKLVSQEGGGEK